MWITQLKIRHDCIIGNRCRKFKTTTTGTPFSVFVKDGVTYSPQMHIVDGNPKNVKAFIVDLKRERKVQNLEVAGNTIFLIEVQEKQKVTASVFATLGPKIIFVKPVFVDQQGFEHWEVASWKKDILMEFIAGIKAQVTQDVRVVKMRQTKLNDIYFSHLLPRLTDLQKKAAMLALQEGYYRWPKKTDFGTLAKLMGVSVPTYREHLKKAEQKLMPDLIKSTR